MYTGIPLNLNFTNLVTHRNIEPFQSEVITTSDKFIVDGKELTRVCPHNQCLLNYDNQTKQFVCPCHSSKFNLNGNCLEGPACPNNIKI